MAPERPKSFAEKLAASRGELVYLVTGNDRGKRAWYYLRVEKLKLPLFLKRLKNQNETFPLLDFGEIVLSGWGERPPPEAVEKINAQYS